MNRTRQYIWTLASLMALVCWAGTAQANPIISAGDTVTLADGPGNTGGGEFVMTVNGDSTSSFITFCLQRTEYIDFSHTFTVDAVSTFATSDAPANGGDVSGHDPVSQQTAYLYTMFRDGTLAGYNYGVGRTTSANNLQNAIWMFEQELAMNLSNPFVILANAAVSGGAWSGIGDVRALNLSRNRVEAQDQLALQQVPEPAVGLLLLFGVALTAGFRGRAHAHLS